MREYLMSQFVSDDNGNPLFTGLRVDCRVVEQSRLSGEEEMEGEMEGEMEANNRVCE